MTYYGDEMDARWDDEAQPMFMIIADGQYWQDADGRMEWPAWEAIALTEHLINRLGYAAAMEEKE